MSEEKYDVVIIGAGPGGYLAAQRAGAKGKNVLLIDKDKNLGGVCLNRGCIPTKALLNSAKIFHTSQNSEQFGVRVSKADYDIEKAMEWKNKTISILTKGVAYQMKRHNVTVVTGQAQIIDKNSVSVQKEIYKTNNIIIATGSSSSKLPIPGIDKKHVVSSDEILEIKQLPKKLAIIGGGVIGLEFASYFSLLGVSVTVIEMLPEILPGFDKDISTLLRKSMNNCHFETGATVDKIDDNNVHFLKDGNKESIAADMVLVAVGRTPNVSNLGLKKNNIDHDQSGIKVNDLMQTNVPGVYAVGDVTGKSLLAHSAYRMGEVAVNVMFGENDQMRYQAIPWVVYTYPEVSKVGLTENEAKEHGLNIKVKSMQMRANGRFLSEHGSESGICKVIVDSETEVLLGVTLLGGVNSEIIYGAAAMIEAELRVKDIKDIIFPHPTVSEIIKDAIWEMGD
jgi:dihydrolipoamide dehydrogenase